MVEILYDFLYLFMENKRPRLDDPEEYRIIKAIHFKETRKEWNDLDPIERLERMQSKERNNNKSSR